MFRIYTVYKIPLDQTTLNETKYKAGAEIVLPRRPKRRPMRRTKSLAVSFVAGRYVLLSLFFLFFFCMFMYSFNYLFAFCLYNFFLSTHHISMSQSKWLGHIREIFLVLHFFVPKLSSFSEFAFKYFHTHKKIHI